MYFHPSIPETRADSFDDVVTGIVSETRAGSFNGVITGIEKSTELLLYILQKGKRFVSGLFCLFISGITQLKPIKRATCYHRISLH
jgi:hypothetical protein